MCGKCGVRTVECDGVVWCVMVWCVMVWCVMVWCVMVWCVMMWCGVSSVEFGSGVALHIGLGDHHMESVLKGLCAKCSVHQ